MYTTGDSVIYTGLPGALANGKIYVVDGVGENNITLMDQHGEYQAEDFYPMREFRGNDDNHLTNFNERIAGKWTLPSDGQVLMLRGLIKLCTEDKLQTIDISDIGGMGFDLPDRMLGKTCACCGGERFITADMQKPIFLIDGLVDEQLGRRYRNMDGKHRIAKRKYFGLTTVEAYVFHIDEILPYIN